MTGPEHYREAEALMRYADVHQHNATAALAEAQVHATLALAAATAAERAAGVREINEWTEAIT